MSGYTRTEYDRMLFSGLFKPQIAQRFDAVEFFPTAWDQCNISGENDHVLWHVFESNIWLFKCGRCEQCG